jgi:hypothetical protein
MRGVIKNSCAVILAALCAFTATADSTSPPPDPSHIAFTLPKDIKWEGSPRDGFYQAKLFGDPDKVGLYGILIKWMPGHFSHPHFHSTDRYAFVISGTWWVSSSDRYDLASLYPMPAGTFVTDIAKTVHWDGAKDEPAVLELVGMGPVVTTEAERK